MDKRKKEREASSSEHSNKRPRLDSKDNSAANRGSTQPTIPAMFSSQRPVQKVSCPVCATKLSISMINDHLDMQCLVVNVCNEVVPEDTSASSSTRSFDEDKLIGNMYDTKDEHKQEQSNIDIPLEQSSGQSTTEIKLQSNKITISYPDTEHPLFKIECQINGEAAESSTEGKSTFGVKVTSPNKTTSPLSLLSKRLSARPQAEKQIKRSSNIIKDYPHSTSNNDGNSSENQPQNSKVTCNNKLVLKETVTQKVKHDKVKSSNDCIFSSQESGGVSSSQFSQRFSQVSPAKPAKVKVFANPLCSPPRSQKSPDSDSYFVGRVSAQKFHARSKVSKSLFPDEDEPSTSHQMTSISQANLQTSPSQSEQTMNSSHCPNSQGIFVKQELSQSVSQSIPRRSSISPAKPAKVKIYSSPLCSPPKAQSTANTNCNRRQQDTVSQSGIISTSQETLVPSAESYVTDPPESPTTPDSVYWTPSPPRSEEEVSNQSQQAGESLLPYQESSENPDRGTDLPPDSQSSGNSVFLTADDNVQSESEIIPPTGEVMITQTKEDITGNNVKSSHREFSSPIKKGTPSKGTPRKGTPGKGTPRKGTPRKKVQSPYKRGVPYYLGNFKLILDTVLGNADDRSLFSDTDLNVVDVFRQLSAPAQELYVRLYQRKHAWLKVNKLEYPHIASDLRPAIKELIEAGFFMNENDLKEPEEILNLLQLPELRDLAKSFKVNMSSQNQRNLVQTLLLHGRKQKSVLGKGLMNKICQRAKNALAECIKLNPETKTLFSRLMLLFSITSSHEEEDRTSSKQTPMQILLMADMGRTKFARYKVERPNKIFHSRDELIRYEIAHKYESDIITAMEKKHYDVSFTLFEKADEDHKAITTDKNNSMKKDASLPTFLRRHTALWVYTRITYLGVEILQKQDCYNDAVKLLRMLLKQTVYCQESRGRWWDRLALNLSFHLKKPKEALDAIKQGLTDKMVKPAYCLSLQQRAEKICGSSAGTSLRNELNSLVMTPYQDAPKENIMGRILPHAQKGRNNVFVRSVTEADGDVTDIVCGVEEVALAHYRKCGYNEGIHAEGSSMCTLIFLLFWDIVFTDGIPDVFRNKFQAAPLDLRTQDFYLSRQQAIDARVERIRHADPASLVVMLQDKWEEVYGEMCAGVIWQTFRDLDHAKSLLVCFGGEFLSKVAERVLKDHEHFRAGMPDLTVWNTSNNTYKLVEVKGPGDYLSHKQIIWLDFFLKHGVPAEVCHVKAYTQKKQRMRAQKRGNDET